jgi:O-antigen/teichoic acid export membrane protein
VRGKTDERPSSLRFESLPLGLEVPPLRLEVPPDLSAAATRGVRWVGAARLVAEITTFGSIIILARIVPPASFGRAMVALIVFQLAQGPGTQGIAAPIVRRKHISIAHVRAALTFSLIIGLLGTGVALLFAATLATLIFDHETAVLIAVIAPSFLFVSLYGVPQGLLQRRLDFRALSLLDAGSNALGSLASIAMAVDGLKGLAIVLGQLVVPILALTGSLLLAGIRLPRPGWDRTASREISSLGIPATLSGLIGFATNNVDYALVGARLGPVRLGYYSRAFRVGAEYQTKVSAIMTTLALPLFARTKDRAELVRVRGRMLRVHALILFPLLFLLMTLAPVLVPLMFGPRWDASIAPTQILAGSGLATVVLTGTSPLMLALGRADALIKWAMVNFALFAGAVFIAVPHGIVAVAAAGTAVQFTMVMLAQVFLIQPIAGISAKETFVADLIPTVLACLPLVALSVLARIVLEHSSVGAFCTLVGASAAGLAGFAITLRLAFQSAYVELQDFAVRTGLPSLAQRTGQRILRLARFG